MARQPAWFTMLMIALHGNGVPIEPSVEVTDRLRNRLITVVDEVMAKWEKQQIPDSVLWSLADKKWHTSPILQRFNSLCQLKEWTPTWHVDAHYLLVGGRTYELPTETSSDQIIKKQQKKARLAAMALIDLDDQQLDPKWLAQ